MCNKCFTSIAVSAVLALCTMAFSAIVFAALTGTLNIRITDSAGIAVEGATIHASTADSMRSSTGVTDANGKIRLGGLDVSELYIIAIDKDGYQPVKHDQVQVISDRTFNLDYMLQPTDGTIEEIIVTGYNTMGQLVDTTSALQSTDVSLDAMDSFPTGRTYQAYLQMAPTTKPSLYGNPSSKSGMNYSGWSGDNVYYVDGVNITDNLTGGFGGNVNSEIIQEQQIITGGVPAEYEGGQGLISRVITKSGGNTFSGSVNYYFQNDSLVFSNDNLTDATFSTFDTAVTLGGPIFKDKLWFFASFQRKERDEDIIDPVTQEALRTVDTVEDLGFAKLTWQATDNDKLIAEFFNDPYDRNGSSNPSVVANRDSASKQGGDNYKFEYSHAWENVILSANYLSHEGESSTLSADSSTRNNVAYSGIDVTYTDTQKGGRGFNAISFRNKESINLVFEWFLDTGLGAHKIKAGYSIIDNEFNRNFIFTGDGSLYSSMGLVNSGLMLSDYASGSGTWIGSTAVSEDDYPRIISAMAASSDSDYFLGLLDTDHSGDIDHDEMGALVLDQTAGNPNGEVNVKRTEQTEAGPTDFKTEGQAFYLQDSWSIDDHWTINAGVRAETWDHIATDGTKVFTFDWTYAPRLSVVYDIKGNGRSKVWAFYGRYYDPIRTDMTTFAGTLTGSVVSEQIYVGNQWVPYRIRGGAQVVDGYFAPTTKTPYTDEIMIGWEHSLTSTQSIAVTYTDRVTKDIMEDYDLGFYTDPEAVGGYALPLEYFGFTTNADGSTDQPDANYFIATLAGGKREYQGLEVTWRKRRDAASNWFALASYSYNDMEGNSNSDGDAGIQGDFLYLDPRAPNVWGPQQGNIEHLLKLAFSYRWDNGIEVGATYLWNSGTLYSETFSQFGAHIPNRVGEAYEDKGTTTRWLAPNTVGSHTSPSFGTLNARLKYVLDFKDRYTAEFFLDIFNVLDDQAAQSVQDLTAGDGVYEFGEANAWVLPRRFYLGVRLSF